MAAFASEKSSKVIINNGTMIDDEVVASDVPPRYLFSQTAYRSPRWLNVSWFYVARTDLHIVVMHSMQSQIATGQVVVTYVL